jgi:monoamine oxidase
VDADVVVIGAGAAGLAAARRLAEASRRVVAIEARDRLGGRVWTRATRRAATPAELGAEFIHGPAMQTMTLLREAGGAAIDLGGESWAQTDAGRLVRDTRDFIESAKIFEAAARLDPDESVDRFLARFAGSPESAAAAAGARAFVEGFEAADPVIASARAIAFEWQSGVDSMSARPLNGYAPVFERQRAACDAAGVTFRLSTIVRRIAWRRGRVGVDTVDALTGETRTIGARAAVVTLPVGVLRHHGDETAVAFEPALPPSTSAALRSLEMGTVVKVGLWFESAFWERVDDGRYREAAFFRSERGAFPAFWTLLPLRSELIAAWAGGPRAAALQSLSADERVEAALDGFGALLGEPALVRRELAGSFSHDWNADPFSRGAYSYVATGGGDARARLAAPIDGTLFFAGEATSTDGQGGTVNGALETGERAAKEVLHV